MKQAFGVCWRQASVEPVVVGYSQGKHRMRQRPAEKPARQLSSTRPGWMTIHQVAHGSALRCYGGPGWQPGSVCSPHEECLKRAPRGVACHSAVSAQGKSWPNFSRENRAHHRSGTVTEFETGTVAGLLAQLACWARRTCNQLEKPTREWLERGSWADYGST